FAEPLKKAGLKRVNISLDTLSPAKYKSITRGGYISKVLEGIEAAKDVGLTPIKINVVRHDSSSNGDIEDLKKFCEKENLQIRQIEKMNLRSGSFSIVRGGSGGNCTVCNRLRLMSNGYIKPCLFSNKGYNVREHGIEQAFLQALQSKPEQGGISDNHQFYNIGG
ncbi:radical SAM protein, partial [Bacteroidota bacterium]